METDPVLNQQPEKNNVRIITIGILVVIILIVGAAYLFINKSNFQKEEFDKGTSVNATSTTVEENPVIESQSLADWLIGITYPPVPTGMTFVKHYTMDIAGHGDGALAQVNTSKGPALLFERVAGINPKGYVGPDAGMLLWKIIDVIPLPELSENEYLAFFCGEGYKYNSQEVYPDLGSTSTVRVVVVEKTFDPVWRNIKYAWRANLNTNKLEEIPTEGIICHNDILSPYYP